MVAETVARPVERHAHEDGGFVAEFFSQHRMKWNETSIVQMQKNLLGTLVDRRILRQFITNCWNCCE